MVESQIETSKQKPQNPTDINLQHSQPGRRHAVLLFLIVFFFVINPQIVLSWKVSRYTYVLHQS